MNNPNLAIMVSASDKEYIRELRVGSVMAHAIHLGKLGKVFWQATSPGGYIPDDFKYPSIKKGYFYLTSIKKVFYAFDVEFIKAYDEIDDPDDFIYYVPRWRLDHWRSEEKENWGYWILITDIKELSKLYDIKKFNLVDGEKAMENAPQTYSIIIDPEYETV